MNRILYNFVLILIILASGCKALSNKDLKLAKQNEQMLNYALAKENYQSAWDRIESAEAARGLAFTNMKTRDFANAEPWFRKLEQLAALSGDDYFYFAKTLGANGKFEEGKQYLESFESEKYPEIPTFFVEQLYASLDKGKAMVNAETRSIIEPIKGVNTEYSEFGLSFFDDQIYFASDRIHSESTKINRFNTFEGNTYGWTGNGFVSIYGAKFHEEENKVNAIHLVDEFSYPFHIGPLMKSKDMVFYTKVPRPKESKKFSIKKIDITVFPGIYYKAVAADSAMREEMALPFNDHKTHMLLDPFWDQETRTLYFASDMSGGYGGTDLYKVHLGDDGEWGDAINLGDEINTPGDERSPFLDQLRDFYFASDGHVGLGGLDVFKLTNFESAGGSLENLGVPINSNRDDFSFIRLTEDHAYLSSDRTGGKGSDDLYRVLYNYEEFFSLTGKVLNRDDESPIANAVVTAISKETGLNTRYITEDDGSFKFKLPVLQAHNLDASASGFFTKHLEDVVLGTQEERLKKEEFVTVYLEKMEVNKTYKIENIFYDFDKWDIRPDAEVPLLELVKIMEENPTMVIELHSHTDSRGNKKYNQNLSEKRAQSAVDYIVSQGIDARRITAKGFGMDKLINHCGPGVTCTDEEHQLNRRTEFIITKL